MRESRADTARAIWQALGLHALLFALMFVGLLWTRAAAPVSAAGSPVTAELIDADALSPAMQRTLRNRPKPAEMPPPPQPEEAAPLPQPLPEPRPEDSVATPQPQPQDFIPVPDNESQEAVVDQPTPIAAAEEDKVQEAKRKQDQVDLTEQKRQEQIEKQRRLAEQQDQEREQKLAEIRRKREAATRERTAAERAANLANQRAQQVADARATQATGSSEASPPPGNAGTDTGLEARYAAALQEAILSKWTRPETVPVGARCKLLIRQLPGGQVMSAEVSSPCAYDEQGRRSIEAAVLKAQPLPYAGFEKVFARNLTLNFTAQDR
ncbi:cell envelope integrity protein TolA [Lysobacter sp. S4-A87]|uniref:cell envelope integrity protein TolA n=1 Tax=Lysobacter sp. S4-A87 TaxID=2925843 RepID=UPI001F53DA0B|nr:cell envelope integrity protein TolA [Lysobacter sp. S4-A87]UNK49019.1 cell envelope integrity protein TolA [Lysobacter sp. S4-A87]